MRITVIRMLVCSLVVALLACGGGDSSSPSTPTPTPTPARPVTIAQGSLTPFANHFFIVPITTSAVGALTVQVAWTFASNQLWVGIAPPTCTVTAYQSSTCTFLALDQTTSTTPSKTVTLQAAPAGSYAVLLYNTGATDESLQYSIILTPS